MNVIDISMLVFAFGSVARSARFNPAADLNADGRVDIIDLAIDAADYGAPVF